MYQLKSMIKYSFIIPVKNINDYIKDSVPRILQILRDDFEIIVYPNETTTDVWEKTRQIATGDVGPAEKRSLAIRDAQGEIIIFVDDDAYPEKNFLDVLDESFEGDHILAVGGPAITPKENSLKQKISGAVFLSKIAYSHPERYAPIGEKKFVEDWPTVNLSIRKDCFEKIGGFDCAYWPGEDTKLCLDIIEKLGGKILYNPELIVWHHRREDLGRHLKQIGGYGLHRGFFAKKYPQTSLKPIYFVPSLFVLFLFLGGALSFFSKTIAILYVIGLAVYALALVKAFFDIYKHEKNILVCSNSLCYIFCTHIIYGTKFIHGFIFTKELKSNTIPN